MKNDVVPSTRSKRDLILRIAADEFGRHGFDATKWADIARSAGIGNTALYHYFESKTHCLFTLMLDSYQGWLDRWTLCLSSPDKAVDAILSAVAVSFHGTQAEAVQNRLLANEQGKLSTTHGTGREEQVRLAALQAARQVESLWIAFLTDAMATGALPQRDPTLLAHAIIGLLQSVWMWYRPGGTVSPADLEAFYCDAVLRIITAPASAAA